MIGGGVAASSGDLRCTIMEARSLEPAGVCDSDVGGNAALVGEPCSGLDACARPPSELNCGVEDMESSHKVSEGISPC